MNEFKADIRLVVDCMVCNGWAFAFPFLAAVLFVDNIVNFAVPFFIFFSCFLLVTEMRNIAIVEQKLWLVIDRSLGDIVTNSALGKSHLHAFIVENALWASPVEHTAALFFIGYGVRQRASVKHLHIMTIVYKTSDNAPLHLNVPFNDEWIVAMRFYEAQDLGLDGIVKAWREQDCPDIDLKQLARGNEGEMIPDDHVGVGIVAKNGVECMLVADIPLIPSKKIQSAEDIAMGVALGCGLRCGVIYFKNRIHVIDPRIYI